MLFTKIHVMCKVKDKHHLTYHFNSIVVLTIIEEQELKKILIRPNPARP